MKLLLIGATVLSVIPLALALFMPDWYLGDTQNAVDAVDLRGERVLPLAGPHAGLDPTRSRLGRGQGGEGGGEGEGEGGGEDEGGGEGEGEGEGEGQGEVGREHGSAV